MRYRQQYDGDWIKPRMKGYFMKCCKCGLVHRLNFKVIKHARGHGVVFQAWRLKTKKQRRKK